MNLDEIERRRIEYQRKQDIRFGIGVAVLMVLTVLAFGLAYWLLKR